MPGPLTGFRVLDFTRVLAGPLCTMVLGDLGADVIKVERPGTGDETRGWGPPFDARGESAYFLAVNRNKLSLALDLDSEADRGVLLALLREADVVVDNFRPGTLERRGLVPQALLAAHPALIWCTLTGFGLERGRPGYDFVVQAESGWMAITGEPEGAPMKVGVALADVIAGKDAAIAVIGALAGRVRGGEATARRLVISLAHSATAALVLPGARARRARRRSPLRHQRGTAARARRGGFGHGRGPAVAPSPPGSVRLPPPALDQHGARIRRLGWTAFDEVSG